jgi:drug/metabolite transporter (DMT)-like permease
VGELLALLSMCYRFGQSVHRTRINTRDAGQWRLSVHSVTTAMASILWLYFGLRDGWLPIRMAGVAWFAAAGVLTMFIGRVFVFASVQHLGAVRASAVKRLNPMFSVLLGVSVLGETLDAPMIAGMLLIFSSFGLLVRQSMRAAHIGAEDSSGSRRALMGKLVNLGYVYGLVSALAYATGYVARKQGLTQMPDPLGTMIGAVVGALVFVLTSGFVGSYRQALRSTFKAVSPWLVGAGVMSSAGQILFFLALNYSSISRVALITSMETFVTILLMIVIFRSREGLTTTVLLAAGLGAIGTALIVWQGN